jgi:type IV pilus modification protein PilV
MTKRKKIVRGFSILEALIALLVVGVAMLGLGKMQGVNLASSGDSRIRSHAVNLAQDKIEEFRKFANQDFYTNNFTGSNDAPTFANVNFTRTWIVSSCPNSGSTAVPCKQIAVTVTWTNAAGASQTVRLTSYIAEMDPVQAGVALDQA